jgi:competence protein ComEC
MLAGNLKDHIAGQLSALAGQQFYLRRRFRAGLRISRASAAKTLLGARITVVTACLSLGGVLIAAYGLSIFFLAGQALIGLALGLIARKKFLAVFFCAIPIASFAYFHLRLPNPSDNDISKFAYSRGVVFSGYVSTEPDKTASGKTRFVLACDQLIFPNKQRLSGNVLVTAGATSQVKAKDKLIVKAYLTKPSTSQYPWQFDYAAYLRRRNIFCLGQAQSIQQLVPSQDSTANTFFDAINSAINEMRSRMISAHRCAIGQEDGDVLTSVVLGNQSVNLSQTTLNNFRNVGLTHILAASGFNLTIVIAVTCWLTNFLTRSIWITNGVSFVAMLIFVALAGPCPSIVRAALMCAILLLGRSRLRQAYTPALIAVALLITLLIDPGAVTDVGLQLSYAATASIVFGARSLASLLSSIRLPKFLAEALAVCLMAEAGVLPIQLTYFWQLGLLFLPANLLVAPLVEIITVIGFASSTLAIMDIYHFLQPAVYLLDKVAYLPLTLMLSIVNTLASCKEAVLLLGPPITFCLVLYYICFCLMLFSLKAERFRTISFALLAFALCGIFVRPALPPLSIASLDHCLVVINSQHQALVIGDSEDKTKDKLLCYLSAHVDNNGKDFTVNENDGITIVTAKQSGQKIIIVNRLEQLTYLKTRNISDCAVAVINDPPRTILTNELICNRLRRLKTRFVIIAGKAANKAYGGQGEANYARNRLKYDLMALPDVQIFKQDWHKPILIALNSDNQIVESPQAQDKQPEKEYDRFHRTEATPSSAHITGEQ